MGVVGALDVVGVRGAGVNSSRSSSSPKAVMSSSTTVRSWASSACSRASLRRLERRSSRKVPAPARPSRAIGTTIAAVLTPPESTPWPLVWLLAWSTKSSRVPAMSPGCERAAAPAIRSAVAGASAWRSAKALNCSPRQIA